MTNDDPGASSDGEQGVRHARDSSGNPPEAGVARTLSELARDLQAEPDMAALLQHIVAATVEEIDGADYGGISLVDGRSIQAVASTNPIVKRLDQLQESLNEGPCLSALREQITVRANDLGRDERWPGFTRAAVQEGVHAMLSVQLFVDGDNLGALNLYSPGTEAFDFVSEYSAMALAAHAAVAMKGSQVESNLRTALVSRDLIGQAEGILMERYKISANELTSTGELRTTR